jgi:hypothetical protein
MSNIKMDLKVIRSGCGLDSSDYWAEQVADSCEHYDEPLHFTKNRQFLTI